MSVKEAQRHHFIPQVLLKNFAAVDDQLWFWRHDFEPGKVIGTGVKNLFVEKDLYAFVGDDGAKDIGLERRFARQDEAIGTFLRQLLPAVRSGDSIKLDNGAWRLWHLFFYFLVKRSPGYMNELVRQTGMDVELARKLDDLKDMNPTSPEQGVSGEFARVSRNANIYAQAQMPGEEVLQIYSRLGLVIYRVNNPMASLVIGDVPGTVAAFAEPDGSAQGKLAFYPVAPDIALGYLQAERQVKQLELSAEQVDIMNVSTAARSRTIAGASREVLLSLQERATYVGPQSDPDHPDWNGA
jgi:hypothetical protein